MRPIELGEVIATRELQLLDRPGMQVKVLIGRPQQVSEDEWRRPYQIVGIGDEVVRAGTGDAALISGLSNCGYEPAEKDALRHQWSSRLNQYGLFVDYRRRG